MNKKKKNQLFILCGLLVLVIGASIALKSYEKNTPKEEEKAAENYSVIDIDVSRVTEIGIIGSDNETTNLIKAGEEWKVLEDEAFLVDNSSVELFLDKVSAITSSVKIEKVTDMSQYGLDEPVLNITLQWENNMYIIKVGDYNSMISSYYIRINDDDTVYTIDSALFYSLNKSLEDFEQLDNVTE